MHLGNMLHDRKPQACAPTLTTAGFINAIETLKNTIKMVVGNADPLIAYVDDQHGVVLARTHPDITVRITVGNRIIEQIDEGLLQEWGVDRGPEFRLTERAPWSHAGLLPW